MPEHTPFDTYLDAVERGLRHLPPARRAAIRRELMSHLEDALAARDPDPADQGAQQAVLAEFGPSALIAARFDTVYGGWNRLRERAAQLLGVLGALLGMLGIPGSVALVAGRNQLLLLLPLLLIAACGTGLWGTLHPARWRAQLLRTLGIALLLTVGWLQLDSSARQTDPFSGLMLLGAAELQLLSLALTSPVIALSRRARWLLGITALLLMSFVAPFSALPNPLGAVYLATHTYRYIPDQPFVNRFATAFDGDPVPLVRQRLAELRGRTGLTPLDPRVPLVDGVVRSVQIGGPARWPQVEVELRFADGSVRPFTVPAVNHPTARLTALDGLVTEHRELPGLPFPGPEAPLTLGTPERLALDPATDALALTFPMADQSSAVRWSPDSQALLVETRGAPYDVLTEAPTRQLWLVPLAGGAPRQLSSSRLNIAQNNLSADQPVAEWSADGSMVIASDCCINAADGTSAQMIQVLELATGQVRTLGPRGLAQAVSDDGVYTLDGGAVWRYPLDGRPAARLVDAPGLVPLDSSGVNALAVDPAGRRAAYNCGNDLCVVDLRTGSSWSARLGYQPPNTGAVPDPISANLPYLQALYIRWSPDGSVLALSTTSGDTRQSGALRLFTAEGAPMPLVPLPATEHIGAAQWLPDGHTLILPVRIAGGLRVLSVDLRSGALTDLSQPGWDAGPLLAPDGNRMLLQTGRGGWWVAPLVRRPT